jgi:hypothetical protein
MNMKTKRPHPWFQTVARTSLVTAVSLLFSSWPAPAKTLEQFATVAVSSDSSVATPAIVALRAAGPAGLNALLQTHADLLRAHTNTRPITESSENDETWSRLKSALDAVGRQRDCYASRLYWFTDFDQASAAATASGKPILSLRLLGNLDEELSCANSRFFRTTLYANGEVAAYLRDHFILHWKSVRPVPRVTIDFGDGRKIERTITGNSIHYVLTADGRVIDALPGLYGPKAFLRGLERAEAIERQVSSAGGDRREALLREYHSGRIASLESELQADLQTLSAAPVRAKELVATPVSVPVQPPSARAAGVTAVSKYAVEKPILEKSLPPTSPETGRSVAIDDSTWSRVAALHAEESRLDGGSVSLIRAKSPTATDAGRLTASKRIVEDPLLRQIRNLERSIAEDTVRNEYDLHSRIHSWLAGESINIDQLNKRVYAELFLTPDSDPWLGLLPQDVYAALDRGGVSIATKH